MVRLTSLLVKICLLRLLIAYDYFIQAIKKEVDNDHQLKATEQPYHMMLNRLAEQYKEMSTYGYRFPVHLLLEKFNDNFAKYEPT